MMRWIFGSFLAVYVQIGTYPHGTFPFPFNGTRIVLCRAACKRRRLVSCSLLKIQVILRFKIKMKERNKNQIRYAINKIYKETDIFWMRKELSENLKKNNNSPNLKKSNSLRPFTDLVSISNLKIKKWKNEIHSNCFIWNESLQV